MGWVFEISFKQDDGARPVVALFDADSVEEARGRAIKAEEAVAKSEGRPFSAEITNVVCEQAAGYVSQVIADNSGEWVGNGLVFASIDEAHQYVVDLASRWFAVRDHRVVPTFEPPTHFVTEDGKVGNLDRPTEARVPPRSVQL